MTDDSIMPWGKYQGKRMAEIPDHYLLWLYENQYCSGDVKIYIAQNLDAIRSNIARQKNRVPKLDL